MYQRRERGAERRQALLKAARDRLCPILMTTTTTVLGLLPLAIGSSHVGDVLYYPVALLPEPGAPRTGDQEAGTDRNDNV